MMMMMVMVMVKKWFCDAEHVRLEISISGYGSVASPAKEDKTVRGKLDVPSKPNAPSDSVDISDRRKAFEAWLSDKLPFLTATVLQVIKLRDRGSVYSGTFEPTIAMSLRLSHCNHSRGCKMPNH